ncbi:hypothetical protein DFH06DRAFT_1245673 [Mycena polygramma]|nr:hypothetical protein DFH06DRAFT_1245673 [Mycena polygramma]
MSCSPDPLPLFRTLMLCTPCRSFPSITVKSKDFQDGALSNSRRKPDSQGPSVFNCIPARLRTSRFTSSSSARPLFRSTPPSVVSISLSLQVSTLRQAPQRTPSSSATPMSSSSSIRNFASPRQAHCACVTRLVVSSCICTLNAFTENEE